MSIKEISESAKAVYNGQPWYGSNLLHILNTIESGDPNANFNGSNSLGQILEHMLQWKRFTIEKIKGNESFHIELNSKQDWNKEKIYTQEEFAELILNFKTTCEELIDFINDKEDSFLENLAYTKYSYKTIIEGSIQHDLYHAGQLSLLIKG